VTVIRGLCTKAPFRPSDRLPLYLIPMIGYFYTYNAPEGVTYHDLMIYSPGLRVRYDLFNRLALLADLIQVDISVIRYSKPEGAEDWDEGFGGVQWNMKFGIALLL